MDVYWKAGKMENERRIGSIANFYGGLFVKEHEGKCYWSIEDHSDRSWEEIPRSLFDELIKFEEARS